MTNVEPIVSADPAYYWCIGLYASGSTWLFNAGKKVAAAVGLLPGLASAYVVYQAELQFPAGTCNAIIKTHDTDGAAARTLARESQAIWLSLRDPKDCVASMITYHGCSFDEAMEMTSLKEYLG